jgi:hypothetical protein
MKSLDILPWTEKYRPDKFEELVGQDEIIKRVKNLTNSLNIPHMLFAGPAGTGESTLAIIVAKDLFKEFWREKIVDNIAVKTPDKDFDLMVNIWLKYQIYICNLWSRSPSFFHEGSGGRGYRDSCQDSEAICSINHKLTRKRIHQIASLIRREGTSAGGWSTTTGPAKHRPNKDHQPGSHIQLLPI